VLGHWLLLAAGGGTLSGQQEFTTTGAHTFVVPPGVTSISVVCVGAGGRPIGMPNTYVPGATSGITGGGGGALAYRNNIPVTPGQVLDLHVGECDDDATRSRSWFSDGINITAANGAYRDIPGAPSGTYDGGGSGGAGGFSGGGGAGGYSGNGGAGRGEGLDGLPGSGGAGGGGSHSWPPSSFSPGEETISSGPGGSVGLQGQGLNGAGGDASSVTLWPGRAGSGGSEADDTVFASGYGGGGGSNFTYRVSDGDARGLSPYDGGNGAVRIIWPGDERQFPLLRTVDE